MCFIFNLLFDFKIKMLACINGENIETEYSILSKKEISYLWALVLCKLKLFYLNIFAFNLTQLILDVTKHREKDKKTSPSE